MNAYIGTSIVYRFRVVLLRNKTLCCLSLCLGVLATVGLVSFSLQSARSEPNCAVRFTVHADYFDVRPIEIVRQRFLGSYTRFSSEIPYYYHYVKPTLSFRTASENDFQPVEVNSSYVYSAYLDDRLAPDVDSKALPVVRVFTGLPRNAIGQARRNWYCVFWYNAVDLPLVMPVAGITDLDVFDTTHSTIFTMVLCSLPTTSISDPPTSVSLVRDICEGPQNHLRVIDLRKRRQNFEKLSSNASNIISRNKVSNFTICIPPLFGDYMTTGELIEFIEMNRLLGADKFILYLASPKKELISCLLSYARVGLVELNNWTIPFKQEDINYNGQILTQNECLFRSMYRTKYLINQDFDEFIIPTRTTDWQSMLDVIHKNKSPGERDVAASYNFRNLFFPMEAARDASLKESFTIGNYELKTLTKTTCFDTLNPWKQRSKVMGRPERILIWHVHEILDSSLVREGDVNVLVDGADGLLFHYRQLGSSSNTTNRRTWIYQKQLFASVTSRASTSGCMI